MRRVLAVAALAGLHLATGSAPSEAASQKVTVTIKGGRPMCSIDRHRARALLPQIPPEDRTRDDRPDARQTTRQARLARSSTIDRNGRRRAPLCSLDRRRARPCRRRYTLRAGNALVLRARRRRTRPTGSPPSSGPGNLGPAGPGAPAPAQPLDGCPAMPTRERLLRGSHVDARGTGRLHKAGGDRVVCLR